MRKPEKAKLACAQGAHPKHMAALDATLAEDEQIRETQEETQRDQEGVRPVRKHSSARGQG